MQSNLNLSEANNLEELLNSFDNSMKRDALNELVSKANSNKIILSQTKNEVNLHFHTYYSYNANAWSPSRIAWESKKYGLLVAGIVDFDVIDGMDEFLSAGDKLGLRTCAALETRVFINEYSNLVINSPNEPGVAYFMAAGCYMQPEKGSTAATTLEAMRNMAKSRNLQMLEKINTFLGKVILDYKRDVMPLTPTENATERHILAAYDAKSRQVFKGDEAGLAEFWAQIFKISNDESAILLKNTPLFHEKMRSALMKFGGVGYVSPNADTFPSIEKVIEMVKDLQAIPTATWLDGTNVGEADMPKMFSLLADKGVVALNIIPDRNWNIKNEDEKKIKVENLKEVITAARAVDFPICIGTEMNKAGLPFVDNFSTPELKPYINDFLEGAYFFWGHTFLAKTAGIGYMSKWAESFFGKDRNKRNNFFISIARIADPINSKEKLANIDASKLTPANIIEILSE